MCKLASIVVAAATMIIALVTESNSAYLVGTVDAELQNMSSAASAKDANDAGVVAQGYQLADVSGAQACGGKGFDYSRYWSGPLPDGDTTKLKCVSGYRCEAQDSGTIFWCKQFALPLNAKCGGYLFYTLFKCIDGTSCQIDPSRFEPRCLPA
ncbi:unnamed protein product [Phytophthora lilii]|uniref:Unnamed protein product n=1 Tax=Phytophthora lilii TaxID=2077276 RepID=A0A9W6TDL0_9STRA|nr:unnamed protein product [Phytophthora lilii]